MREPGSDDEPGAWPPAIPPRLIAQARRVPAPVSPIEALIERQRAAGW
jgi:hypothetical protein